MQKNNTWQAAFAAALAGVGFGAAAQDSAAAPSSEELEQRIRILERKLELQEEDAGARAKDAVTTSASERGFGFRSADGSYEFRIRGLLQADYRAYLGDPAGQALNDTATFRRIEPSFELSLGKLAYFRLQPQFAGDTAATADAYGELRFHPAFTVRAGKFKEPITLENLQPSAAITFIERGLPTELGSNRDLGVQFQGELLEATTTYAIGVFNGTADGRDSLQSGDVDSRKEVAGRLFFEPFRNEPGFFQGLGLGISASQGEKETPAFTAGAQSSTLPRYRSPGQATVFSYVAPSTGGTLANTVVADGTHTRISPQAYFYLGSFGVLAEHITSEQEVALGASRRTFKHAAYQGLVSYVLTGEDASYKGVKPGSPYVPGGEGWGAVEVAARYGVLDIDDAALAGGSFADPTKSVSEERTAGVAVNWYLSTNVKLGLNYDTTQFVGGGGGTTGAPQDRDTEQALFSRFQLAF